MHTAQSSCWALLYSLPSLLSAALKKSGEKISSDFKPGKINFHFCLGIFNLECFYWRSVRRDVILRFSEASHFLYNRTKSFQLSQLVVIYVFTVFGSASFFVFRHFFLKLAVECGPRCNLQLKKPLPANSQESAPTLASPRTNKHAL